MALDPIVNFFRSTIATLPVASGGTSIVLQTGDGNKLPAPAIDGAFNLTIYNADDPFVAPEIVRVTARSGDTLTVTRAQEGTSATNKTAGSTWNVELTPTAKTIQDIDSAKLDVAGGTMTGDLTIPDKIIHSGDTNTAIRFPANDTVTVETAGSEAFRVDSSQRVGINTTNPTYRLDITNPAGSGIRLAGSDIATNALISGATRGARIGANSTTSFIEGVDNTGVASFQPLTIGGLDIRFAVQGVANEKMRITSTGNVEIANGNLKFSTNGTGIDFSSVAGGGASSSVLDDYERGTFTPTVIGLTTAGTGTYSVQFGRYIKVGKLVTAFVRLTWSAHNGTGNLAFDGLPFTVLSTGNYLSSASIGIISDISMTANNIATGFARANTTRVELFQTPTGGGSTAAVPIDTSASINFTVTYETA